MTDNSHKKSELLIDFVPVIFEQNQIGFQIIHQELKGLSFPNSLFKNHAFITQK